MNSIILVPLRFHLLGLLGWHQCSISITILPTSLTTLTDIWAVFPNCILFSVSRIQYWYFIASKYLCGKFIRMLTMFGLQIRDFWETFSKLNSNIKIFTITSKFWVKLQQFEENGRSSKIGVIFNLEKQFLCHFVFCCFLG